MATEGFTASGGFEPKKEEEEGKKEKKISWRFSHKLTHSGTREDDDAAKRSLIAFANQRRAAAPGKWRWTRSECHNVVF